MSFPVCHHIVVNVFKGLKITSFQGCKTLAFFNDCVDVSVGKYEGRMIDCLTRRNKLVMDNSLDMKPENQYAFNLSF
jgi:hypothetical protein